MDCAGKQKPGSTMLPHKPQASSINQNQNPETENFLTLARCIKFTARDRGSGSRGLQSELDYLLFVIWQLAGHES